MPTIYPSGGSTGAANAAPKQPTAMEEKLDHARTVSRLLRQNLARLRIVNGRLNPVAPPQPEQQTPEEPCGEIPALTWVLNEMRIITDEIAEELTTLEQLV